MAELNVFRGHLRQYSQNCGASLSRWGGASRRSRNLLHVQGKTSTVLYVKVRSDSPGFWGLNVNQLEALSDAEGRWYAVLLVGNKQRGYALSSEQVKYASENQIWSRSDTDYKIHEGEELEGAYSFKSHDDLFRFILPSRSL